MWSNEAFLFCCLCIAASFLPPCAPASGDPDKYGQDCDTTDYYLAQCGDNEMCGTVESPGANGTIIRSEKCMCKSGFERKDKECRIIPPTSAASQDSHTTSTDSGDDSAGAGGGSMVVFLLISTFLVILGAVGYIGARRYKWLQRFRQFHQNRYGSVLVTRDDYDDDDPTLA
ncbi:hypothetical protein QAD02_015173 [Eretmocerus hayati]|uniref:Uncharacterized protein n=1 Tax=Eretmocerus hayati TaxID=131215 RepID=A0ACC2P7H4_9HYME|nr:hypothetical protein QAD02_015173 [Eretmocerus hayati]